jgi:hypothetical protein
MVFEKLAPEVEAWIREVAAEDPARAVELVLRMAEYFIPKLARAEVIAPEAGPVVVRINTCADAEPLAPAAHPREQRENTIRRLVALRDQGSNLRVALEASKALAEHMDESPEPAEDQREGAFDSLVPPEWSWEERAALRERLGLLSEEDLRPPAIDGFPSIPDVRSSQ